MLRMLVPRFDMTYRPSGSLFDDWFSPLGSIMECEDWTPAADIAETDEFYVVTMELPGIDMTKTDISYEDGLLSIKGEKIKESFEGECCHRSERYSGSFNRIFRVPGTVDRDRIDATYKDGILKLTLHKDEKTMPKKITVH